MYETMAISKFSEYSLIKVDSSIAAGEIASSTHDKSPTFLLMKLPKINISSIEVAPKIASGSLA
jgi:hypothetical protein